MSAKIFIFFLSLISSVGVRYTPDCSFRYRHAEKYKNLMAAFLFVYQARYITGSSLPVYADASPAFFG